MFLNAFQCIILFTFKVMNVIKGSFDYNTHMGNDKYRFKKTIKTEIDISKLNFFMNVLNMQ